MSDKARRPLPGDPIGRKLVERIIRVDHAGEYGAKRIYAGQLAVLGDTPAGAVIRERAAAEAEHLAVRPCYTRSGTSPAMRWAPPPR